jgi:peptidoglycan hydrolase-like protein with peptidoglycan-binding domain
MIKKTFSVSSFILVFTVSLIAPKPLSVQAQTTSNFMVGDSVSTSVNVVLRDVYGNIPSGISAVVSNTILKGTIGTIKAGPKLSPFRQWEVNFGGKMGWVAEGDLTKGSTTINTPGSSVANISAGTSQSGPFVDTPLTLSVGQNLWLMATANNVVEYSCIMGAPISSGTTIPQATGPIDSTHPFYPSASGTTYTLTCSKVGGGTVSDSVTVYAPQTTAVLPPSGSGTSCPLLSSYLKRGSTGAEVSALQEFLYEKGMFKQEPTGYFGPVTEQAVQLYQASKGIQQVGNVGPITRDAIIADCGGNATPVSGGGTNTAVSNSIGQLVQSAQNISIPSSASSDPWAQFRTGSFFQGQPAAAPYQNPIPQNQGSGGQNTVSPTPVPTPPVPTTTPTPSPTPPGNQTSTGAFKIGALVRVTSSGVNVRAAANGAIAGTRLSGDRGAVVGGPVSAGGYTWYQIDFFSGADGWMAQDFLYAYTPFELYQESLKPAVIHDLIANPSTIQIGQSTTISFTAEANTCVFKDGNEIYSDASNTFQSTYNQTTQYVSGTITVKPLTNWSYTLSCNRVSFSGGGATPTVITGTPVTKSISVTVQDTSVPVISSFTASPQGLPLKTLTLNWSSDATKCSIYQNAVSVQIGGSMVNGIDATLYNGKPSGSFDVSPQTSGAYTLMCYKDEKVTARSIPVTIDYTTRNIISYSGSGGISTDLKVNNRDNQNGFVTLKKSDPLLATWSSQGADICYSILPNESGLNTNGSVGVSTIQAADKTLRYWTSLFYPQVDTFAQAPIHYVNTCLKGTSGGTYDSATDAVSVRITQ